MDFIEVPEEVPLNDLIIIGMNDQIEEFIIKSKHKCLCFEHRSMHKNDESIDGFDEINNHGVQFFEKMKNIITELNKPIMINFLPPSQSIIIDHYLELSLSISIPFINASEHMIANNLYWKKKFLQNSIPIIGDKLLSCTDSDFSCMINMAIRIMNLIIKNKLSGSVGGATAMVFEHPVMTLSQESALSEYQALMKGIYTDITYPYLNNCNIPYESFILVGNSLLNYKNNM